MADDKRLKIGIFGGSFNPPTTAHAAMASYAHEKLGLDQVWWLIAPHNPFKDKADLAPFADRMAMAQIIAEQHKPWLVISDLESQFGTQQTADTLDKLTITFPQHDFVWLMGTDNLLHFHLWDRWDEMAKSIAICVFIRPIQLEEALQAPAVQEMGQPVPVHESYSPLAGTWHLLANPQMDIAATHIRKALADAREPDHVDSAVLDYIRRHGLYRRSQ